MKLLGLLAIAFGAINALKTKALHLNCEQELKPYNAVLDAKCMAFALNGSNINEAIRYLKAMNIEKAYVLYWNDHDLRQNPMVLYSNGTLAPLDPHTNTAKYVLCVETCTCPGSEIRPSAPAPCEKIYIENNGSVPCEKIYIGGETTTCKKIVVNPSPKRECIPCEPCDSSSSDEVCKDKRCKVFPRVCKKACGSRHRRSPKKVEVVKSQKTFTFDVEKYRRRGEVVVRVCSKDSKDKFEKFVLSRNGEIRGKNDKCVPEVLPKCLRCPSKVYKLKKRIERDVCQKVCMYINSKCEIFVLIGDCEFYRVIVRENGRHRGLRLRKVRGHKLKELIKHGLFGVEFGPVDCN
ncbi:spore wall and anchoring disk complex protein EnP1 [Encephalitozoon romaleae SJ-2008]|uniref:Spore wall and anchoring disk complex protein EnP1 n=1 Tax=Encephalitozoon romaleae (strain SJ-2008) TaxID=1178016 RepID=I7ACU3_ENCRO|nr:spore wall and anchoring disk complex protein EnP1 [Encephalitozoon romaleae SJ-2008]AFN82405.1 spore wall and anchoring disk complex protein EnP1 [Encephalitozoon romaleae SJ-2008]